MSSSPVAFLCVNGLESSGMGSTMSRPSERPDLQPAPEPSAHGPIRVDRSAQALIPSLAMAA